MTFPPILLGQTLIGPSHEHVSNPNGTFTVLTFSPVRTRHPFEEAVTQITEAIRAGDLGVADRLPSERALALQMDISRPTLREAVKILVDEGVLEVRKGATGGIFVKSDVLPSRINNAGWKLRVSEVSDLLEARRIIQSNVAMLAGLRATATDLDAMSRTLELLRASLRDRTRFMQLDERFQLALARASRNQVLITSVQNILRQIRIARDFALREDQSMSSEWALNSLTRIYEAVRSGSSDAIAAEMGEHLSYLEQIWQAEIGRGHQVTPVTPPSLER